MRTFAFPWGKVAAKPTDEELVQHRTEARGRMLSAPTGFDCAFSCLSFWTVGEAFRLPHIRHLTIANGRGNPSPTVGVTPQRCTSLPQRRKIWLHTLHNGGRGTALAVDEGACRGILVGDVCAECRGLTVAFFTIFTSFYTHSKCGFLFHKSILLFFPSNSQRKRGENSEFF